MEILLGSAGAAAAAALGLGVEAVLSAPAAPAPLLSLLFTGFSREFSPSQETFAAEEEALVWWLVLLLLLLLFRGGAGLGVECEVVAAKGSSSKTGGAPALSAASSSRLRVDGGGTDALAKEEVGGDLPVEGDGVPRELFPRSLPAAAPPAFLPAIPVLCVAAFFGLPLLLL